MADNTRSPAVPVDQSSADADLPSEHVNLRITYMLTGNPRPPHSFGRVALATTVAALKERVANELPEHPSPSEQRLIYQGRPLLQPEATLRDVLRLDPGTPAGPLPYTLHIIIRRPDATDRPLEPPQQTLQAQASPNTVINVNGQPQITLNPGQQVAMAENHLNRLQADMIGIQQRVGSSMADLRALQQRIADQQHVNSIRQFIQQGHPVQPGVPLARTHQPVQLPVPRWQGMPNGPGAQVGRIDMVPALEAQVRAMQDFMHTLNPGMGVPDMMQGGQQPEHQQGVQGVAPELMPQQHQEQGGVQTAHLGAAAQHAQAFQAAHLQHAQAMHQLNMARHLAPPSVPGPPDGQVRLLGMAPESTQEIQEFQGPDGGRTTVVTEHTTIHTPHQRPASAPGHAAARVTPTSFSQHQPPTSLGLNQNSIRPQTFSQSPAATHLSPPFAQTHAALTQPRNTTAWLLYSPLGPQALVFAPGHGYFSSASSTLPTSAGTTNASQSHSADPLRVNPQMQPAANTNTPGVQPADAANRARALIRQPNEAQPAQDPNAQPALALAQRQLEQANNDMFGFIMQRGWLFLRLYLFMLVFSDANTWKRWLMMIVAAFVCAQPRNGWVSQAITAARRRFDNLIGPPQRPQPAVAAPLAGQGNANANATDPAGQRPANVRGAVQMTPEEAAARLVREHREQNRGFWRDTLYWIEQSTALFLASLIPGVGERHVRAREDARREAQRLDEEEERRRNEDAAAANAPAPAVLHEDRTRTQSDGTATEQSQDIKVDAPDSPARSSGVQVRDTAAESSEVRSRAVGLEQQ